jgi:hypothetical protein
MMLEESKQRLAKDLIHDTLSAFDRANEAVMVMKAQERRQLRKAVLIAVLCTGIAVAILLATLFI